MIFYPHYEIQRYIDSFSSNENIVIAKSKEYNVPELLQNCSLLITDYSSVFFDVSYQNKPIIYYQFDYKDFRNNHYKEGYFSYEKNGFGKVLDNKDSVVSEIIRIIESKYKIDKEYAHRLSDFFYLKDKSNCERIYNEIIKM